MKSGGAGDSMFMKKLVLSPYLKQIIQRASVYYGFEGYKCPRRHGRQKKK